MVGSVTRKTGAVLTAAAALVVLAGAAAWAKDVAVISRPLSGQEIKDYALPATTQKSAGLFTLGLGEAIYLDALADTGTVSSGVTWTLTTKPAASTAALATSALGTAVPVKLADRAGHILVGRTMLVPDKAGAYTVTALIARTIGDTTVTRSITAATYVGVGTVGGATPVMPQCALCHADQATAWDKTLHAHMLEEGVNGVKSDHYAERCVSCHSVGYNTASTAVNGGFDDVLKTTGWGTTAAEARGDTAGNFFKEPLTEVNFAKMPKALQAVSNIQCENCHGAGSEHKGDKTKIDVSLEAGTCGYCHDSLNNHAKNAEWRSSLHAAALDESGASRASCVICHTGPGFIERIEKGIDITDPTYATKVTQTQYGEIGCTTCHDPHDATNPNQLRTVADVTLMNGVVVSDGGKGKLCMACHKSRRNGPVYAKIYHSRHNPHGNPQTDMLVGTNAVDYGKPIRKSTHLYAAEEACATCHMQTVAAKKADGTTANPAFTHVGGHTYKMKWDGGTASDPSDDVEMTEACAECHGPMESFDIPKEDYDGDGKVEGVQTEVQGLLATLGNALPPDGPTVTVTNTFTEKQLQAAYNYSFVVNDGSMGIHNTQYAVGILKASIQDVTGRVVRPGAGVRRRLAAGTGNSGLVASAAPKLAPLSFGLTQNYPNPFNPETEIRYAVAEPVDVRLDIYNALGQRVRTLVDASHGVGEYTVRWDARDQDGQKLTGGIYFYTMQAGNFVERKKMILLP